MNILYILGNGFDKAQGMATSYPEFYEYLKKENLDTMIYKPQPCPIDKIKNRYRWRIILKGKLNNKIIDIINLAISNINSKTTRIIVDTNPTNLS